MNKVVYYYLFSLLAFHYFLRFYKYNALLFNLFYNWVVYTTLLVDYTSDEC